MVVLDSKRMPVFDAVTVKVRMASDEFKLGSTSKWHCFLQPVPTPPISKMGVRFPELVSERKSVAAVEAALCLQCRNKTRGYKSLLTT